MRIISHLSKLLLIFMLSSCSIFFGSKSKKVVKIQQPPHKKEEYISPEERERMANSYYNTARAYEVQYYKTGYTGNAKIAIEQFEQYYCLCPDGVYAALSLLRKTELYFHIGKYDHADFELNRLKKRNKLSDKYKEEIQYIENLLK